jgi:hypothetical protein
MGLLLIISSSIPWLWKFAQIKNPLEDIQAGFFEMNRITRIDY